MFDDSTLVEDRIERLHERLGKELFRVLAPVHVTAWKAPGEPVDFATAAGARTLKSSLPRRGEI